MECPSGEKQMKKFLMADINQQAIDIDTLEVQSFEMNVYLVKLHIENESGFVYDNADKPMRFFSTQQIREMFEMCGVKKAIMVHDSPYDEMIGNPEKAQESIGIPFSMAQPY